MSRTILGTLTAPFTPPATCPTPYIYSTSFPERDVRIAAWGATCTPNEDGSPTFAFDLGCLPTGAAYFVSGGESAAHSTLGAFSGTACPAGFSAACMHAKSAGPPPADGAQSLIQGALGEGETYVGCCPVDMGCDEEANYLCTRRLTAGDTVSGLSYTGSCEPVSAEMGFEATVGPAPTVYGFQVPLIYAAGEKPAETSKPSGGEVNGGQNVGAKVGVNGGVTAVVALLVAGLFLERV